MAGYYAQTLSAERLKMCYDLAPPRVDRYLDAEIAFVLKRVQRGSHVLELGCGYGRVLERLAGESGAEVFGVDTSAESLRLARERLGDQRHCHVLQMDAIDLAFPDDRFDIVICIQNGISAFGVDRLQLVREAVRVTKPGGRAVFSSYAAQFWPHRLAWFRIQADHGLIGPIDEQATGDGVIVCTDGFRAATVDRDEFRSLAARCGVTAIITEVDESSVFCELPVT